MCCRRVYYALTLAGYFGTFILLVAWYTVLAPSLHFPVALVLLVLVSPLLFPLRGLLHGRSYTFSWSGFLAVLYFIHGVVEAYSTDLTRLYGLLEVLFTVMWFTGAIMYVRVGQEMEDR
jgi:uncharacterized membrane protein